MKTRKLFFSILVLSIFLIAFFFSQLHANAGYLSAEQLAVSTVYLPLVFKNYSPEGSGYGNVTGYVRDARTDVAIVGVKVCLEGMITCPVTNTEGKYTLTNIPNGTRKLVASDPAGIYLADEELVVVLINTTVERNFNMLQSLEADQMRVKVTWDDRSFWQPNNIPNDLNLHMWWDEFPYGDVYERIDIAHPGNCQDLEAYPYACYENDEWYGTGPDTIAFQLRDNVVYSFAVLNYYADYPGVPPLKDIIARTPRPRVEIYVGTQPSPEYEIEIDPILTTGEGDLWYVFKWFLGNYELQNCMTQYVDPGDTPPSDLCVTLNTLEKLPERR